MTNERETAGASRTDDAATSATTISADYAVTIPKSLCDRMRWRPGQELTFIPKGAGALLITAPTREALIGLARGADAEDYRDRNDRY
jgi:bifunctional DNA-binding transcriptional regulator/antitoxin component of YhaV-PrlF toxin-antitoxin module